MGREGNGEGVEIDQPSLLPFAPDADVHLGANGQAVVNVGGHEPERTMAFLSRLLPGLQISARRRAQFSARYLDRLLGVRRPSRVTLDASATAVARGLWAAELGWRPLRVVRHGQRLVACSQRWPRPWRVVDAPWPAILCLEALGVPFDIDPSATALLTRRLGDAGRAIASAGLAGSAIVLEASRPDLLESLSLPGLGYLGGRASGRYRMPLLAGDALSGESSITTTPELDRAIARATRRTRSVSGPEGFPWTLYAFQARDLGRALRIAEYTGGVLVAGEMGTGKELSVDTAVMTPQGARPMGSLEVGDQVLGSDGRAYAVTGVHPQGVRRLWKVTFCDGAFVLAGDDHLWAVSDGPTSETGVGSSEPGSALPSSGSMPWVVRSTAQLQASGLQDESSTLRWRIPVVSSPLAFATSAPSGDAHARGAELGAASDGSWEGLEGHWRYAPIETRVTLLDGALEANGGKVADDGTVVFSSDDPQRRSDVAWLVESLGGIARREVGLLSIALPAGSGPSAAAGAGLGVGGADRARLERRIASIEEWGQGEAVCISVASPDACYVVEHAVVTHNTTVSLALIEHKEAWPLLVVAPLAAFSTWARQLGEMGKQTWLCVERRDEALERFGDPPDAVVISYDRLHDFVDAIEHAGFAAIIADEIQRIRTPGSRRSRALRRLAGSVPLRVGLSGTPITNRAEDILPLGAFLVPAEWPPRLTNRDLAELYVGDDPVESLAEHLGTLMVRRRMEDVGVTLPGRDVKRVFVPLSPEQRRALEDLEAEARAARESGELGDHLHVFARLQRMRQVQNVPTVAGVAGPNTKLTVAVDLAGDFAERGLKSIIFVADRQAWVDCGKMLAERGMGWTGIWGSTPIAERIANERRYHEDPTISVFVGTLAACGESLTLSPTARATIFASLSYSPSTLAQAAARAYRMNTTDPVSEIYLCSQGPHGTLDDRIWELLTVKRALFAQVVDRTDYVDPAEKVSLGDLVYLLTGQRDEKLDLRMADEAEALEREQARKRHARATAHRHKSGEFLDDGSVAQLREELEHADEDDTALDRDWSFDHEDADEDEDEDLDAMDEMDGDWSTTRMSDEAERGSRPPSARRSRRRAGAGTPRRIPEANGR